jgi:hypothetical protein
MRSRRSKARSGKPGGRARAGVRKPREVSKATNTPFFSPSSRILDRSPWNATQDAAVSGKRRRLTVPALAALLAILRALRERANEARPHEKPPDPGGGAGSQAPVGPVEPASPHGEANRRDEKVGDDRVQIAGATNEEHKPRERPAGDGLSPRDRAEPDTAEPEGD